jgi:transcriptional regulator with XRE-family HTH domain
MQLERINAALRFYRPAAFIRNRSMPKAKKSQPISPRSVDDNDRRIGERIRTIRVAKKISQAALGDRLGPGISFQQVQKYEKGVNRVGAVRLQEIAAALGEPVSALLASEERRPSADFQAIMHAMADREVQRLVKSFVDLPAPQRHKLMILVETMAA